MLCVDEWCLLLSIINNCTIRLRRHSEKEGRSSRKLFPFFPLLARTNISQSNMVKVACLGAGYVGGPTCAVLALKAQVQERIAGWNSNELPIYEPGLHEVVMQCRGKTLFFTTDIKKAIQEADIVFVSVQTPTKKTGIGAGVASDLTYIESCARTIAEHSESDKIIVEKSTVPCGTASVIQTILKANNPKGLKYQVLSNPEFLAEGTAIDDLMNPDRVLIGSNTDAGGLEAAQKLKSLYAAWVEPSKIFLVNTWSSELSKLAANAMLAQRVSSVNALSALCEVTGANVSEVTRACGMDQRIGKHFLQASLGFGGSCFQKDIQSLVYISQSLHLNEVADYWRQVMTINDYQKVRFVKRIISRMFDTVTHKKIAVLGFAFKKNTGDTRETAAATVVRLLAQDNANVFVYDPKVKEDSMLFELRQGVSEQEFQQIQKKITHSKSVLEACSGADAVVICTEWDEFKDTNMNYEEVYKVMRKPAFLFDGRLIVNASKLSKIGFQVEVIGSASSQKHDTRFYKEE
ncbi:UDP-glucose dehydrogenase [Planoprotostelium fungivorum]|uniref:UDP-glucose 6-dehydrogenase n=1 Tax=Planoprotostelium fungivorum TaxID=1890364 RepID=A0A2P6N5R2_9EUKA|nr:UDP-glucose dehydrogenase [Planoprotostelium fungivorum]